MCLEHLCLNLNWYHYGEKISDEKLSIDAEAKERPTEQRELQRKASVRVKEEDSHKSNQYRYMKSIESMKTVMSEV